MKKTLLTLAAAMMASSATFAQDAPAFPGAEGHGRYVTGGRGGTVYHVTSLEDTNTEGTLRYALTRAGTRTIVFDVSGTIYLNSDLDVNNGNVSVLGQTAPGQGITLAFRTLNSKANNVIFRFIRFRRSQVTNVNDGADAFFGRNRKNIILDHCSFSWSIDEVCSVYDNQNFTLQWSTITEGLNEPGHSKGAHSYGGIWGGKGASFHHNLIAHVQNRAPRFNGARYKWTDYDGYNKNIPYHTVQSEQVDFRNHVIYNWGNGAGCYGGPGGGYVNIINNYYKAGPGTKNKTNVTQVTVGASGNSTPTDLTGISSRYFIEGNYVTAAADPESYDWKGVSRDGGLSSINGEWYIIDENHVYGEDVAYVKNNNNKDCVSLKLEEPIDGGYVTTHTAEVAYEKVLTYAGASIYRDAVDVRNANEARTGTVTYYGDEPFVDASGKVYPTSKTPGIPDWVNDPRSETQNPKVPSFPTIKEESRPADWDTDGDGIPNYWEIANGLDPNDPDDGKAYSIDTRGWYTNLEVYANSLVEQIMKDGNADAEDGFEEYYPEYVTPELSGIENIKANSEIVKIEFFTLDGVKLDEPVPGLNIRRMTYADGHIEADKVIKQ